MTRRAVLARHPEVDASFLGLEPDQYEDHAVDGPGLERMILIDCPDPDTPDPEDGTGRRHLDILRSVSPRCDVQIHTATSQKYATEAVARELLANSTGSQLLYVQTHASVDDDNRVSMKAHLETMGLSVPEIFRIDAEDALTAQERGEEVGGDFGRIRQLLIELAAGRARHRIRRSNFLGLFDQLLTALRGPIEARLEFLARLETALHQERRTLHDKVRARLMEQVRARRRPRRKLVLRQLATRWGSGPFSGFLGLWSTLGALGGYPLLLMRARTPTQAVLTTGVALGQSVAEAWRERRDTAALLAETDLGLSPTDLARSHSILRGYLVDAAVEVPPRQGGDEASLEELAAVARRASACAEAAVNAAVEQRIVQCGGAVVHGFFELAFTILPVYLLYLMARNFFYEHPWQKVPLLGFEYYLQAAFWCLVWALVLGGTLLAWLVHGLDREVEALAAKLTSGDLLGPLFGDLSAPCEAIRRHLGELDALCADFDALRSRVGRVEDLGLGSQVSRS
jgi:hypothetical protein